MFNDKACTVHILITSNRISSTAINLQKDCSTVIFVDVPSNAQSTLQAAGRVIRIGQKQRCTIYILTIDHTYDQVLQATAARKMIGMKGHCQYRSTTISSQGTSPA